MGTSDRFALVQLKRRDAIRLLGGAAGVGALAAFTDVGDLFGGVSLGAADTVKFPQGAIIRTILKDYPPAQLGVILVHEHMEIGRASCRERV